jgi:hypothetical protein
VLVHDEPGARIALTGRPCARRASEFADPPPEPRPGRRASRQASGFCGSLYPVGVLTDPAEMYSTSDVRVYELQGARPEELWAIGDGVLGIACAVVNSRPTIDEIWLRITLRMEFIGACKASNDVLPFVPDEEVVTPLPADSVIAQAPVGAVVARSGADAVVPTSCSEHVGPPSAYESVIRIGPREPVSSRPSRDRVGAKEFSSRISNATEVNGAAATKLVGPSTTTDVVDTALAEDQVVSLATKDQIVPTCWIEVVMAGSATDDIIPWAAIEGVVAPASDDDVAARRPPNLIVAWSTQVARSSRFPCASGYSSGGRGGER